MHAHQMPPKSPVYLPAELVHAVLLRLNDRDAEDNRLKRGLAACSLICRHWARVIRPLLFLELALRSAADVEQLLAFLARPDVLGRPLRDCIKMLSVVEHEDRGSKAVPWLHHILRLRGQFAFINVSLTMSDTVRAEAPKPDAQKLEGQPEQLAVSTLPFAWLPKTLPTSLGFVRNLTLRGLRVRSLRALVSCIARLRVSELTLEELTFAKHDVEAVRARRVRHSAEFYLTVSRCFVDAADAVPRWLRIANMLFAAQGYACLDDTALALLDGHVPLLLSFAGEAERVEHLNVRTVGSLDANQDGYEYNLHTSTALLASLTIFVHALRPACPEIRSLHFTCPSLAATELPAYFSALERTLLELNGASTPLVVVTCPSKSLAADALEHLRTGSVFPVLFGQRRSVHVVTGEPGAAARREFTAESIVASFRPFAVEGERITLDKAQRVEWLLRKQSNGSRKAYVRKLVLEARVKVGCEGAN